MHRNGARLKKSQSAHIKPALPEGSTARHSFFLTFHIISWRCTSLRDLIKDTLSCMWWKSQKGYERRRKSPAPGRSWTLDLTIKRWVFDHSATTAAFKWNGDLLSFVNTIVSIECACVNVWVRKELRHDEAKVRRWEWEIENEREKLWAKNENIELPAVKNLSENVLCVRVCLLKTRISINIFYQPKRKNVGPFELT